MLKRLQQEYDKYSNQYKFVSEIMSGELKIFKKKNEEVNKILEQKGYQNYQKIYQLKQLDSALIIDEDDDEKDDMSG